MVKNGPFALFFHTLIVIFMLAPMVVVCLVAFTPENTLSVERSFASLVPGSFRA
jgi:putative spermidine/putrescine transport system permease protein